MSVVTRPRGPLPARVYWTRRLLVLLVALGLVFGIARLLGTGGGGDGPSAQPVGAEPSPTTPSSTTATTSSPSGSAFGTMSPPASPTVSRAASPSTTATPTRQGSGRVPSSATATTPAASPTGQCTSSDILAVPALEGPAYAGRPVVFLVTLTTKSSPACTWNVSSESLVVKVTSGSDRIWSTQECPAAVAKMSVVVRKDQPVQVPVTWSGLRSDAECTRTTSWAEAGYYHAAAAALGGDPADEQFELVNPPRPTVTATPTSKNRAQASPSAQASPKAKPSSPAR